MIKKFGIQISSDANTIVRKYRSILEMSCGNKVSLSEAAESLILKGFHNEEKTETVKDSVDSNSDFDISKIDLSKAPSLKQVLKAAEFTGISEESASKFFRAIVINKMFRDCSGNAIDNWITYMSNFTKNLN